MDREIPIDLSYLRAIQKIPGDTPGEKFSWIGRLALHQTSEDIEQFPPELLPLLHVETAVKKKRHEDITSALKCDDLTIINRAFKASWFFDGSYKEIVDVAYFCNHLFPYVSINTRTRIVKTLAYRLKDPVFAQQMFIAVESIYDIQTAYPLFLACDTTFAYDMIVKKKFVLPAQFVKQIFRKNLDLAVRFLKLLKLKPERVVRIYTTKRIPLIHSTDPFAIGIDKYQSLLPKLIKKRIEDFVELYEIHQFNINFILSNTRTEIFLKKAKQHLIKKPYTYIHILSLKQINEHLIEKIFPDLLPEKGFSIDKALKYLIYYPDNKKEYELLCKRYKCKCRKRLLFETKNVTEDCLKLLPIEERNKLVSTAFKNWQDVFHDTICYLPVNEAISYLKEQINRTESIKLRSRLIEKMMKICTNNKNDDVLSDTLMYFLERHKNENRRIFQILFHFIDIHYPPRNFNEKQLSLVVEIIQLFYVKNGFVPEIMFKYMVHFRLKHNMPMEQLIDIFLENNHRNYNLYINGLEPQDERRWIVIFLNIIQKKHFKNFYEKKRIFVKIVQTINKFNDTCKCYKNKINVEKLLIIRDYPWLMDAVFEILRSEKCFEERFEKCFENRFEKCFEKRFEKNFEKRFEQCFEQRWDYNSESSQEFEYNSLDHFPELQEDFLYGSQERQYDSSDSIEYNNNNIENMHRLLQSHEPELYRRWLLSSENITFASLTLPLKSGLQNIQENWEKYLDVIIKNYHRKRVHHFIRSIRWYKDLPIKFAEFCMDCVHEKREDKISSIIILAILLHGEAVTKLIDFFISLIIEVDNRASYLDIKDKRYKMRTMITMKNLSLSMKLSNPPIHLNLIITLCVENHLPIALMTLRNISRRIPMLRLISCAEKLTNIRMSVQKLTDVRVSVQKHGIRLMSLTSFEQLLNFYQKMLSTANHYSIQQVLFDKIQKLFFSYPKSETWSLYCQSMSSVKPINSDIKQYRNTISVIDIIVKMIKDTLYKYRTLDEESSRCVKNHKFIFIPNEYIVECFDLWLKTMDNFYEVKPHIIANCITELLTKLSESNIFDLLSKEFIESIYRRYLFHYSFDVCGAAISFTVSYLLLQNKDEYITCFKVVTDIFHEVNTATTCDGHQLCYKKYNWLKNISRFKKTVRSFIYIFVIRVCKYIHSNRSINPQVIDSLQILFSSYFSPEQDAKSYLRLVYAKKFQEVCNESSMMQRMKAFGLKIGQHLPELIDIFSSLLISFMAEILKNLIREICTTEYVYCIISVIESLVEIGNTDSYYIAVKILPSLDSMEEHHKTADYCQLIEKFEEMQEPFIKTILYEHFFSKSK